jgi:hypothetical protein
MRTVLLKISSEDQGFPHKSSAAQVMKIKCFSVVLYFMISNQISRPQHFKVLAPQSKRSLISAMMNDCVFEENISGSLLK